MTLSHTSSVCSLGSPPTVHYYHVVWLSSTIHQICHYLLHTRPAIKSVDVSHFSYSFIRTKASMGAITSTSRVSKGLLLNFSTKSLVPFLGNRSLRARIHLCPSTSQMPHSTFSLYLACDAALRGSRR